MNKLIITAGHSLRGGKGTGAHHLGRDEAHEARRLVDALIAELGRLQVPWLTENDSLNLKQTIGWVRELAEPGDVLVDVHFNAATIPTAHGTEVFVAKLADEGTQAKAAELQSTCCLALGTRDRGVKPENLSQHNRLGILHSLPGVQSMLLEVAFLTNTQDMVAYDENFDTLVAELSSLFSSWVTEKHSHEIHR